MTETQSPLIPPFPGLCPVCAGQAHGDELPHNWESMYYQFWFLTTYRREATWADAAQNCSQETKIRLRNHLEKHGISQEIIGDLPYQKGGDD